MDWANVSTELFDRFGRYLGGGRGMKAGRLGMARTCPKRMDATQECPAVLFCSIRAPILFHLFPFSPRQVFDQRVQQLANFMEEHDHLPARRAHHQATCCMGAVCPVCHWRRKQD